MFDCSNLENIYNNTVNWEISRGFYFRETSHVQTFVKIRSLRNGETTLSFTEIGNYA